MGLKIIWALLFIMLVTFLLAIYWFVPITTTEFKRVLSSQDINKTNETGAQFYNNMRFPDSRISYKIDNCPLKKKDDMLRAFGIISERTILRFYESDNEEIFVTCDSRNKIEGNLFIAGEGGPTNITQSGDFNVITDGKILLIKESSCPNPNIAIHELFHVLGFGHSENEEDIMYSVTSCNQEINPNTLKLINSLYSIPGYSDLSFEDASAVMRGKYLNVNMSVRNIGLRNSVSSKIDIYSDDKLIKEMDLEPLDIGHGRVISLTNLWVAKINTEKIILRVKYSLDELKKDNNELVLEIKK